MAQIDVDTEGTTEISVEEPRKYKVILYNDNVTTFDFVIKILQTVFSKPFAQAFELTNHIHATGAAIVGIYTKEIAEEKVSEVTTLAKGHGYPLVSACEKM